AALPADEHRAPAERERLILRLAEHRLQSTMVPVHDVDAEMAVRGGRVERSLEQPQRLRGTSRVRPVIGDDSGRGRFDLGERGTAWRADPDHELVALGQ